jgi:TPP-dependent 2-oxoacid decarboxylase
MVSIKIGEYLNQRLKEVGIDVIFGCPGDYNMVSYIYTLKEMHIKTKKHIWLSA